MHNWCYKIIRTYLRQTISKSTDNWKENRMCPWDRDVPADAKFVYFFIAKNAFLWTKGNNSWRHGVILSIIKLGTTQCDQVVIKIGTYRLDTINKVEFSWKKGINSFRHGMIWTIIELVKVIMVLNKVTKFHKILIKNTGLKPNTMKNVEFSLTKGNNSWRHGAI